MSLMERFRSKPFLTGVASLLLVVTIIELLVLVLEFQNNVYLQQYVASNSFLVGGGIIGTLAAALLAGYVASRSATTSQPRISGSTLGHSVRPQIAKRPPVSSNSRNAADLGRLSIPTLRSMKVLELPSSILQVGTVAKYEMLNYFRSRRFYVLTIIGLIISAILTAVVAYYRPAGFLSSALGFYSSWWGLSVTFVLVLSGIFFGGDAISGEFQNKTGYFLVANPLRRSSIYVGKWLAALTASLIVFAMYAAIAVANGVYYLGLNIPYQFGLSLLFSLLYLVAILGFTFFFSSLFKSNSMSILVTSILFLFVFNIVETLVRNLAQIEPWFLITYGAQIIGNVLTDPYPSQVTMTRGFGPNAPTFTSYAATIPQGIAILSIYFILTAVFGLLLFERKEFA